jgi:hypothetical protein
MAIKVLPSNLVEATLVGKPQVLELASFYCY